jgi:hypothetical protein
MEDVGEIVKALHRSGGTIGDAGFVGPDGSRVVVVSGTNVENQIRAVGATELEAWSRAADRARAVGMLGR